MNTVRTQKQIWVLFCIAAILVGGLVPARSQIVISQVFGGGGNSGAPLKNDFIELFNQGSIARSIDGWTIQYASAAGSSWQSAALHGMVLPRQWFLVQLAAGASNGGPLPVPDDSGSFGMSASGGKVALVDTAITLTGSTPSSSHIVDLLGWGSASYYLGTGPAPATSNTTAAIRRDSGMASSGDNSLDFRVGPPQPRNSATSPLPVQITTITASIVPGSGVRIVWNTISEIENFGFVVERKKPDDSTFNELEGSFQPGFGTTLEAHSYSYTDSTGDAACLYRLRQVDLGGGFHYSDTIRVDFPASVGQAMPVSHLILDNYPNPFNPNTTIQYTFAGARGQGLGASEVRIVIYDVVGRAVAMLVDARQGPGTYEVKFDGSQLASGVYICHMTAGASTKVRQMNLVK